MRVGVPRAVFFYSQVSGDGDMGPVRTLNSEEVKPVRVLTPTTGDYNLKPVI